MPYMGVLKQATNTSIQIANNNGNSLGYMILKVNRRDKIASADHQTVAAGATGQFTDSFATGIERTVIYVSPPLNGTMPGTATATVTQGATTFSLDCAGDTMLVFDCAP
jgi:hypothetical protein